MVPNSHTEIRFVWLFERFRIGLTHKIGTESSPIINSGVIMFDKNSQVLNSRVILFDSNSQVQTLRFIRLDKNYQVQTEKLQWPI